EDVGTVGGSDDDNSFVGAKPVHLHQKLVKGLLPLVVTAAQAGAPLTAYRVYFIDEDDARGMLFGLFKEVPDPGSSDADEHLNKIGAADAEERVPGFSRNRPGQQGFACARRAEQQHTLGNAGAQLDEFAGGAQILDDFFQLFLGLVDPRHIGKGNLLASFLMQPGPALAKVHDPGAAALGLLHKQKNNQHQNDNRRPAEQGQPEAAPIGVIHGYGNIQISQPLGDGSAIGNVGYKGRTVGQFALGGIAVDLDTGY